MKSIVKLAIAAAVLSAALVSSLPQADACIRTCTIKCLEGTHCEFNGPCARCVPD